MAITPEDMLLRLAGIRDLHIETQRAQKLTSNHEITRLRSALYGRWWSAVSLLGGLARTARAIAAVGASIAMTTMTLGLASAPAHAASSVEITHKITVPGQVRHQIDVHLPMNQEDAAGYIWNGARIEVRCYGDDWFDDQLPGVPKPGYSGPGIYKGKPAPGQPGELGVLTATPDGVHLTIVNLYEKGRQLNEDILPTDNDEVYCKARWIDADGYILRDTSNTVRGKF